MTPRIVLCDDAVHILRAAEFKFKRAGMDVRCAYDGQEAWEMIEADPPDLLVTDLQMPRMDGLELCARVRECEATANLPVILLTAKGFELADSDVAEKLAIRAIVPKPFSPRQLLKLVQTSLEEAAAAQPQS